MSNKLGDRLDALEIHTKKVWLVGVMDHYNKKHSDIDL